MLNYSYSIFSVLFGWWYSCYIYSFHQIWAESLCAMSLSLAFLHTGEREYCRLHCRVWFSLLIARFFHIGIRAQDCYHSLSLSLFYWEGALILWYFQSRYLFICYYLSCFFYSSPVSSSWAKIILLTKPSWNLNLN